MRRSGLLVVLIAMFAALFVGVGACRAEWELQETGAIESLKGIFFINENVGWVYGANSTLLKTTDGGKTWESLDIPGTGGSDIKFIDENTGLCHSGTMGEDGYGDAIQLKTTNGGKTWDDISIPGVHSYNGFCLLNVNEYWTTTDNDIFHTNNGGETWEKQETMHHVSAFPQFKKFIDVDFIDSMKGWALGGNVTDILGPTYVYKTENGGKDWYELSLVANKNQRKLYALNENDLWACNLTLNVSHDGGKSWSDCESESDIVRDIYPVDELRAYVLWTDSLSYTEDGGNTFKTLLTYKFERPDHFTHVSGVDGKYIWCLSRGGAIVKYTADTVSVENDSVPDEMPILTNAPNPFNPATTISFTLPADSHATLTVHDITGRKVATLADNFMSAGKHSAVFDGSNLASGVYFLPDRGG